MERGRGELGQRHALGPGWASATAALLSSEELGACGSFSSPGFWLNLVFSWVVLSKWSLLHSWEPWLGGLCSHSWEPWLGGGWPDDQAAVEVGLLSPL